MDIFSHFASNIQRELFPDLEECWGVLTGREEHLVAILEVVRIDEFLSDRGWGLPGRPLKDRGAIARAFVAKAVLQVLTTRALIRTLHSSPTLRKICGWNRRSEIPGESTFSRAFACFAHTRLPEHVHAAVIKQHYESRLVGHISRDSTSIEVREKAIKRKSKEPRGQRLRLQAQGTPLNKMIADLPTHCDFGCKRNSKGQLSFWRGYKLHVDWADGEIPISCLLTSASTHDSQVAIPLATMTVDRVTNLYDLMDSAYDSETIRYHSRQLGHVPIIEINTRGNKAQRVQLNPAQRARLRERTTSERGAGRIKDSFGGRTIFVRGAEKVMAHLMFGILALTAEQLLRLVT